jgi:hypothetical protein
VPEIGLITVFWPLTTTGAGRLVVQTGEARFVVDCKVKPVTVVGHINSTFAPQTRSWVIKLMYESAEDPLSGYYC